VLEGVCPAEGLAIFIQSFVRYGLVASFEQAGRLGSDGATASADLRS